MHVAMTSQSDALINIDLTCVHREPKRLACLNGSTHCPVYFPPAEWVQTCTVNVRMAYQAFENER
jgi:hypothetical protein